MWSTFSLQIICYCLCACVGCLSLLLSICARLLSSIFPLFRSSAVKIIQLDKNDGYEQVYMCVMCLCILAAQIHMIYMNAIWTGWEPIESHKTIIL